MPSIAAVTDLIARSNRLGSDARNTNFAGGNTSAKGQAIDPVTRGPVEVLWVKGSGGDLGTLTESGLAVLRLDRRLIRRRGGITETELGRELEKLPDVSQKAITLGAVADEREGDASRRRQGEPSATS